MNVKLGDFGLATEKKRTRRALRRATDIAGGGPSRKTSGLTDRSLSSDHGLTPQTLDDSWMSMEDKTREMTNGLGTYLYMAPELAEASQKAGTGYSEKVDIYSLGIVFFEMCFRFGTATQRFVFLTFIGSLSSALFSVIMLEPSCVLMLVHAQSCSHCVFQLHGLG
jgi:translation initiation factor 2-alpha kinase 4